MDTLATPHYPEGLAAAMDSRMATIMSSIKIWAEGLVANAQCAAQGCTADAAWATRTKPAWCQVHAREQFRTAGMEPQEDVLKATTFTLAACLTCGTATHVKLEYALDKASHGEMPCRACYWKDWASYVRGAQGTPFAEEESDVQALAERLRFEYLRPLTTPSLQHDPHLVRCTDCERITAEPRGDIGWGCQCQKASKSPARPRRAAPDLFKDSGSSALEMWDYERNSNSDLATAPVGATRMAHWTCLRCGHQFTASIRDMVGLPHCDVCWEGGRLASESELERYAGVTISEVPELLAAWAGDDDPSTITVLDAGAALTAFQCSRGHRSTSHPLAFLRFGCSTCRSAELDAKIRSLAMPAEETTRLNPEMAAQWHPDLNQHLDLRTISPNSKRDVTWQCQQCFHEWNESPKSRQYASSLLCPQCRSVFASLAFVMPDLAAEWSPGNQRNAWQVRPHGRSPFLPEWVCATKQEHVFEASLTSRANGSSCPQCRVHGKSRVELNHYAAAVRILGDARSGTRVHTKSGRTWHVDITIETDELRLAVEYDGSYWHRDKEDLDTTKSHDLLADGWSVIRLREYPLAPLPVNDTARYLELTVYATAPAPAEVMTRVADWAGIAVPRVDE